MWLRLWLRPWLRLGLRLGLMLAARGAFAIPLGLALAILPLLLGLTFAVLAILLFATRINLALRFAQHPQIMFGVLLKVFGGNTVAR